VKGSPRWNYFDLLGDIRFASAGDRPYIYVAVDDAGKNSKVTLDGGTPYAGCDFDDGYVLPEYKVNLSRVVTEDDCIGSTFISRTEAAAIPASSANTGTYCGAGNDAVDVKISQVHRFARVGN